MYLMLGACEFACRQHVLPVTQMREAECSFLYMTDMDGFGRENCRGSSLLVRLS